MSATDTTTGNALRDAARDYASRGWSVFPCEPRGKRPLARLVPHGLKDATTDEEKIRAWWSAQPDANVAVVTGEASGLFVVDVDAKHDGEHELARLIDLHGSYPDTVEAATGGGGRHYFFKHPGPAGRCTTSKLAPGIDTKGEGGYVLVAPSIHPNGNPYLWVLESHPSVLKPADPPDWILELLRAPEATETKPTSDQRIPAGQRNATLASMGGTLRRAGFGGGAIEAALLETNATRCDPALGAREVVAIARSIERYPAREIRVVETEARPQPVDFASILKHGLPPVPWILRGWLAEGDILTISGAPYSGKTTTAYALALALAHGTPWLGLQPTARVRVLIVDEEMGQRRAARLLLRSNGMKEPDRDWLRMFCEKGLNLTIGAARLEREIEDFRPDVTILDSMTKMLVGIANENDAMQVAPAFSRMKDLRAAYGTGFAVVDHCGKPREATVATLSPSDLLYRATRGSSVKQSEPDAIFLQSGAGLGLADLTQVKRRESGLISVRIGYTEDGEDGPIELSNRGTPDAELTAETRAARWIVAHLADVGEARRSSIVTAAKAAGFSDGVAERAVRGLRDRGEIEQPQRRAPYRLAQRLAQPEPGATLAQRDAFDAYAEHEETAAKPTRGFDCD